MSDARSVAVRDANTRGLVTLLPWGLWCFAVALTTATFAVIVLTSTTTSYPPLWGDIVLWGGLLAFITVGALIASRHPENRIGWLLCACGLLWTAKGLANEYAVYSVLARREILLGATLAAWADTWLFILGQLVLVVYLPLWFPTGRVAGRRWRIVERVAVLGIAIAVVGVMTKPGPLGTNDEYSLIDNPLGLTHLTNMSEWLIIGGIAVVAVCALAAIVSIGERLRGSRGVERQQIKWVVYWLGILMFAFVANALAHTFWPNAIAAALLFFIATIAAIPIVIGISILRYHLYDIDRVINLTLVYGGLTAILGALYIGGVFVLQAVLDPLTRGSDLAVAATTLFFAALVRPARNRIQHLVDQRFFRRRYDASQAIAAFSARLRDEIDLDALSEELCFVVQDTMQPTLVTLWLQPADPGSQPRRLSR